MQQTKICTKCREEKDLSDYHNQKTKRDGKHSWCKSCAIEENKNRYKEGVDKNLLVSYNKSKRKKLLKAVNEFKEIYGCFNCPENEGCCLDFHHINNDKDLNVSAFITKQSPYKILNEAKKCIIVCANCHRKIHYKDLSIQNVPEYDFDILKVKLESCNKIRKKGDKKRNICLDCPKEIHRQSIRCVNCNSKVATRDRKVENRPSLESLLKDIEETSYLATARKYGVSDNTIRKWIKLYQKHME